MTGEHDMGVDVGTILNVVIRTRPDASGHRRAAYIGEVSSFEELDRLMTLYGIRRCVIDALPEGHRTQGFARSWLPRVWVAYYDRQVGGHEWVRRDPTTNLPTVHVNRLTALEAMFEEFHQGKAELPRNARALGGRVRDGVGEYYREMTALTRVLEENSQENLVARYVRGGRDDHYAHAEAYCLLASERGPGGRVLPVRYVG